MKMKIRSLPSLIRLPKTFERACQLRIDPAGHGHFISPMRVLLSTILPCLLAFFGCAHQQPEAPYQGFGPLPPNSLARSTPSRTAQNLIVTPDTGLSGKVVKVNTGGRFVVLNFPLGRLPVTDQRLNVYHLGLKIGEVKVSGPQLEDNVVGDLMSGTAQVGDEVRDQ